ncbi:hypothetical protein AeMF1_021577 [Aphanomyces euteiches]|nr:hypothetical protein AeMF1_021577 [Aphanomyces euteiches]KAH9190655.1 hypothetical protein AeNC1_007370 [Aphanomyces euteiches]
MDAVDDEWVWPNELKEARLMETLLRCQVCGEFFTGPVLVRECRHTFCSECIRKHLLARGTNGNCPECKCSCSSSDLIPNRPLEQLVDLFRQLKPKVLQLAAGVDLQDIDSTSEKKTKRKAKNAETITRLPTVSYNVMKDKQIQQLLDKAGLGAILPTSKDNMIACHKEFIMLWNAQLDTMNPKSPNQVRSEVIEAFRLRQQEKMNKASSKKALGLRHDEPLENALHKSAAFQDNFRKLAAQAKAKMNGEPAKTQSASPAKAPEVIDVATVAAAENNDARDTLPNGELRYIPRDPTAGAWRHLYSTTLDKPLFVNSTTHEVTDEVPPSFAKQPSLPVKRPSEPSEWTCGVCTLLNTPLMDRCEACGTANPRPFRPKRSKQSKLSL